jgi:Fic family protein
MVYIYKKTIGGKPYYYLRASERKGSRILAKDVAYLGNSIEETRAALGNLKEYKEKIRKAYKTIHRFLESNHYLEQANALKLKTDPYLGDGLEQIEAARSHYMTVFHRMDKATREEILKNFIIEFSFNTASIEGNTITLQEARNLLENGSTPKDKTLREIYDLQNTERVFMRIFSAADDITHEGIIKIHAELMKNIDTRIGYRTSDVRVIKAGFKATPAPYVKADMEILLKWYGKAKKSLHPFVLAAIFHHKFEMIHPFMDGNGRVGRMLLNLILLRNDYPPLIIHRKFRDDYLDALRAADKADLDKTPVEDYKQLIGFTAQEMADFYWGIFL